MVLGAALGSVAAGYISDLIEEDLELYKQLFAQMRSSPLAASAPTAAC